jgi:hypothetical protein
MSFGEGIGSLAGSEDINVIFSGTWKSSSIHLT